MQNKPTRTELIGFVLGVEWILVAYRVLHPDVYLVGIEKTQTIVMMCLGVLTLAWFAIRVHRRQQ